MQYFLRFYLSFLVVLTHFWASVFGGMGSYAVCGFFVISGYVITKVLKERYFQIKNGLSKFWINRFLRLYPTYIFSALIGISIAYIAPEITAALNVGINLPSSTEGVTRMLKAGMDPGNSGLIYLMNLTAIGMQSPFIWSSPIAFSPNVWSTNVELYFYLLLSLGIASTLRKTRIFLVLGLLLFSLIPIVWFGSIFDLWPSPAKMLGSKNWPIKVFYYSFLGWTVLFAIGAYAYYFPKKRWPNILKAILFACCILGPFILAKSPSILWVFGLLGYSIIIGISLIMFSDDRSNPVARYLGDLAYPLFLIHWPVAGYVSWIFDIQKNNMSMLLLGGTASLLMAVLLLHLVEKPVEHLRSRFRT